MSIFIIFIVEIVAFRWGTSKLKEVGKSHGAFFLCTDICLLNVTQKDAHGHNLGSHAAHGPESKVEQASTLQKEVSIEKVESGQDHHYEHSLGDSATTQLIGVAILEFGLVLHRCARRLLSSRYMLIFYVAF